MCPIEKKKEVHTELVYGPEYAPTSVLCNLLNRKSKNRMERGSIQIPLTYHRPVSVPSLKCLQKRKVNTVYELALVHLHFHFPITGLGRPVTRLYCITAEEKG